MGVAVRWRRRWRTGTVGVPMAARRYLAFRAGDGCGMSDQRQERKREGDRELARTGVAPVAAWAGRLPGVVGPLSAVAELAELIGGWGPGGQERRDLRLGGGICPRLRRRTPVLDPSGQLGGTAGPRSSRVVVADPVASEAPAGRLGGEIPRNRSVARKSGRITTFGVGRPGSSSAALGGSSASRRGSTAPKRFGGSDGVGRRVRCLWAPTPRPARSDAWRGWLLGRAAACWRLAGRCGEGGHGAAALRDGLVERLSWP